MRTPRIVVCVLGRKPEPVTWKAVSRPAPVVETPRLGSGWDGGGGDGDCGGGGGGGAAGGGASEGCQAHNVPSAFTAQ